MFLRNGYKIKRGKGAGRCSQGSKCHEKTDRSPIAATCSTRVRGSVGMTGNSKSRGLKKGEQRRVTRFAEAGRKGVAVGAEDQYRIWVEENDKWQRLAKVHSIDLIDR